MSPAAPRPLSIAFVAGNKNPQRFAEDASFVYRCENLAVALSMRGHRVDRLHLTQLRPATRYDIVVLHRPRLSLRLRWWLARWRRGGVRVLADVDDLVFAPELAEFSPAVLNRRLTLSEVRSQFRACGQALARVDGITVSTAPLQQECAQWLPTLSAAAIHLLPNAVFHSWLPSAGAMSWQARQQQAHISGRPRIIRYLPGTRSHDRDFALIAAPLAASLRRHPEIRLEIVGPLDMCLDAPPGQISRRDKLPFDLYPELFRDTWLNLAPLEDTRFNQCKSALKLIEAGAWGVPTLASPLPDADRLLGSAGLVARSAEDWAGCLAAFCADPLAHPGLGRDWRSLTLPRADLQAQVEPWLDFALQGRRTC